MSEFRIFDEKQLNSNYLTLKKSGITSFFKQQNEEDLVKIKDSYVNQLMEEYKIVIPQLDYENIHKELKEAGAMDIYKFKISFTSNNTEYFELDPGTGLIWTHSVYIEGNNLCFDIQDLNMTVEEIEREFKEIVENIKKRCDTVNTIINRYNQELKVFIEKEYGNREDRLLNRKKKSNALGL